MSQPSLSGAGGERDDREEATPPVSPFISDRAGGTLNKPKSNYHAQKSIQTISRKYQDSSLDADDTESELVAIPESDLSESTLHNSAPSSFDDANIEDLSHPAKSDLLKGKLQSANLSTAQVAINAIGLAEKADEKPDAKKGSRLFMKLNSLDKSGSKGQTSSSSESSRIVTKCSIQEGVRMMVTPSIFMTPQASVEKCPLTNQTIHTQKPGEDVTTNGDNDENSKSIDNKDETDGNKTSDSSLMSELSEAAKLATGKQGGKGNNQSET